MNSSSAVANSFSCDVCNKTFSANYNLRKHVKKFHSLHSMNVLAPKLTSVKSRNYKFPCKECTRNFNHRHHLTLHQKKEHEVVSVNVQKGKKCPLCSYTSSFKRELILHFKSEHDIVINVKSLEFDSLEEFNTWLAVTEKNNKSKFVKEAGASSSKNHTISRLVCHRSGNFISEGKGRRHVKIQGSNKIGAFCPAGIRLTKNPNSNYQVEYIDVHVGHANELGHLILTSTERETLAAKVAAKVPFDAILDEVRDSISNSSLERLHLLTRKDLHNIESNFNLHSAAVRHRSDAVSIESWVAEMQSNGCVLFYKPQETYSENFPNLKYEDFMLIIMNDGRKEILRKYGNDCICIDSTHGTNSYGFEFTTLLVLDDLRQGFPCSFLISNRGDQEVISIFLTFIQEQVGYLSPKVFMSDMAETFYNSWLQVMSPAQLRLYCSWHVDRAWRKNLNKIPSKEKQVEVYKTLRTLMHGTDSAAFTQMLNQFLNHLSTDALTIEFATYFNEYYGNKAQLWAYCFRLHCGVNTNMHIERMHRTIKYLYLHGKHSKRLDKAIHALMRFVRDKLLDRLIVIHKGKISTKVKDIRKRHMQSLKLNTNVIIENNDNWGVLSSSPECPEIYTIKEHHDPCNCQLVCVDCTICIHKYSCSCLDSAVKWNMCKHIHLLCTYRSLQTQEENVTRVSADTDDNNLYIHCKNDTIEESTAILAQLSKNNSDQRKDDNLVERKDKMKKTVLELIDRITSPEQMDTFQKLIAPIAPTLSALQQTEYENRTNNMLPSVSNIPHNKQILPQRRLFSTNKKQKTDRKRSISLPTRDESLKIASALLLPSHGGVITSNNINHSAS